jgi:hypothetical protein
MLDISASVEKPYKALAFIWYLSIANRFLYAINAIETSTTGNTMGQGWLKF